MSDGDNRNLCLCFLLSFPVRPRLHGQPATHKHAAAAAQRSAGNAAQVAPNIKLVPVRLSPRCDPPVHRQAAAGNQLARWQMATGQVRAKVAYEFHAVRQLRLPLDRFQLSLAFPTRHAIRRAIFIRRVSLAPAVALLAAIAAVSAASAVRFGTKPSSCRPAELTTMLLLLLLLLGVPLPALRRVLAVRLPLGRPVSRVRAMNVVTRKLASATCVGGREKRRKFHDANEALSGSRKRQHHGSRRASGSNGGDSGGSGWSARGRFAGDRCVRRSDGERSHVATMRLACDRATGERSKG